MHPKKIQIYMDCFPVYTEKISCETIGKSHLQRVQIRGAIKSFEYYWSSVYL